MLQRRERIQMGYHLPRVDAIDLTGTQGSLDIQEVMRAQHWQGPLIEVEVHVGKHDIVDAQV